MNQAIPNKKFAAELTSWLKSAATIDFRDFTATKWKEVADNPSKTRLLPKTKTLDKELMMFVLAEITQMPAIQKKKSLLDPEMERGRVTKMVYGK